MSEEENCDHDWCAFVTETIKTANPVKIEDDTLVVTRNDSRYAYDSWIENVFVACSICKSKKAPSRLIEKVNNAYPIGRQWVVRGR